MNRLRVVSWNVAGKTARAMPHLHGLRADIAVLPEASLEAPDPSFQGTVKSWHATGTVPRQSLVIAGLTTALDEVPLADTAGRWTAAAITPDNIGIVGIWTCPEASTPYGDELIESLAAADVLLRERPCVVAGDFNLSPNGREDSSTGVLRAAWEQLGDLGYTSAYHSNAGTPYGSEQHPTYFHQYNAERPFVVDYLFVHRSLEVKAVSVGTFDMFVRRSGRVAGVSDHVPLTVDLCY